MNIYCHIVSFDQSGTKDTYCLRYLLLLNDLALKYWNGSLQFKMMLVGSFTLKKSLFCSCFKQESMNIYDFIRGYIKLTSFCQKFCQIWRGKEHQSLWNY